MKTLNAIEYIRIAILAALIGGTIAIDGADIGRVYAPGDEGGSMGSGGRCVDGGGEAGNGWAIDPRDWSGTETGNGKSTEVFSKTGTETGNDRSGDPVGI